MLEFLFSFLLNYAPALSVFIFSIIILIVINIFYKILVNQQEAKQLKQRTKDLSNEMKTAQKAGDTERSKKLMSEMLSQNSKMMRMTMKPMIVSMIVVIVLLPSLSVFYGDKTVAMTNNTGNVTLDGTTYPVQIVSGEATIGDAKCQLPCTAKIGSHSYKLSQEGSQLKVAQIVAVLPVALPIIGATFGWLGWYIICSIPLVIIIRKVMKIYM